MKLQHFYHHHELCFKEVGKDDDTRWCYGCWDIIHGPAYICSICCKVAMHKSCAELPPQIQKHTFHPHPLKFDIMNGLVCDACRRLTFSIISYRCMSCELKLDFKCAMAIFNDENVIAKRDEEDSQGTTIPHFSHQHQLTRCILSLVESLKVKCVACKQAIQGTFSYIYVCIPCLFVIHESCMNEMPRQVQRSPFHPHHALLPRPFFPDRERQVRCYVCSKKVQGFSFYCNECDVNLHVSCANYPTRAIKHTRHPHNLLQLGKNVIHKISCNACGKGCDDSCFSCKECDFNIHPQCIPLPSSFTHKRHMHPLVLVSSVVEDDTGDYCCDICETERNPDLQVYYCDECNFIAHIDCVLSEVLEPTIEMRFDPQRKKENSGHQGRVLHKTIQRDSFHPHSLILDESKTMFVCDGCEELCIGSSYSCKLCSFNLDHKCATLDDKTQQVKKTKTTIPHFSHLHPLRRCMVNTVQVDPKFKKTCLACRQYICGVIYACINCKFFLHESCFNDMLEEVQSLFHPQHPLHIYDFMNMPDRKMRCHACNNEMCNSLVFSCVACKLSMHYSCAKYQFCEVTWVCLNDHRLLHLGKRFFGDESPQCNACGQACENTLWCCLKCGFYIHLECVPFLPSVVKHKRHMHSLVLTTVTEDDSGDYCCDTCETPRNPEHDVYHCKECNYISHIGCIISKVERPEYVLKYVTPRSNAWPYRIVKFAGDVIPLIETNMGKLSEKMESWKDKFFSWKD